MRASGFCLLAAVAIAAITVVPVVGSVPSQAEDYRARAKHGPQVKGYEARRGGYSYNYADTVNTYGDSRSNYGAASVYRDPNLDRQTTAGPFDHGYFFDSGMGYAGGDSPYMQ